MVDKSELRMNLAAIKRVDPYAKDIVTSSAHVAFYTFSPEGNEWEKTDVEGVFFIYSRNAEPFNSIFINNRLNTNSFVEPITEHLELQSQPPFLLYRNERSRIRGFWFYNSSECDRIGELVGRLIKESSDSKNRILSGTTVIGGPIINNHHQSNQMMSKDQGGNNGSVNIFTMLSKAQEDFNNSQVNHGVKVLPHQQQHHHHHQQQQHHPQQHPQHHQAIPMSNPNNNQLDIASQSVMNFFAAAKPAAASEVPLFQRLLSNPVSVDQIEKQQRAATPQQDGKITPPMTSLSMVENGINMMRVQSPKQVQEQMNNTLISSSPLAKFLGSASTNANNIKNNGRPSSQLQSNSSSKPALMPPTMFSVTSNTDPTVNKILPQGMPLCNKDLNNLTITHKPEPLTQTQLLQAMTYLIQNDPEFVKKLHEAYLKSFTEMVSL